MQTLLTRYIFHGLLVIILLSFGYQSSIKRSTGASAPTAFKEQEVLLPSGLPLDTTDQLYGGLIRRKSVLKFYTSRDNAPVWFDNKKLSVVGDSMVSLIKHIRYYGLMPKDYHWSEIETNKQSDSQASLLRNDVLLTDAFLSIANDLKYGKLSALVKIGVDDSVQISLLKNVLDSQELKSIVESQEPIFAGYCGLKQALKILLDTLNPEDRAIFLEGIVDESHPLNKKLQLVEINLERWRWESAILGSRYILINIPSFWLEVISNNEVVLDSKVIVGTPQRQTPLLNSLVECFVIYPYWHVPRKIAVEEYLPIIKESTSFITKNNFDVLDQKGNILHPDSVEWKKFTKNYFPVLLRQREGPENSLGVLKFVFDNPYAVFLHDTNTKRLFKNNTRAFSHGCIRMEKAVELAHYLATGELNKRSKIVEDHLRERKRHTVNLNQPIPIHVRYFTSEFKNGTFYQYTDVYERDQRLIQLFYKSQKSENF